MLARHLLASLGIGIFAAILVTISGWPKPPGGAVLQDQQVALTETVAQVDGDVLSVRMTLTSDRDEVLRAWFFLARPGETTPWERFAYQSPVHEIEAKAGEPVDLTWALTPEIRDGRYEVTAWVHRRAGNEWVHAAGGPYDFGEVTFQRGEVRYQQTFGEAAATIGRPAASDASGVAIPVLPTEVSETVQVTWTWRLHGQEEAIGGSEPVDATAAANVLIPWPDVAAPPEGFDLVVTAGVHGSALPAQVAYFYGLHPARSWRP